MVEWQERDGCCMLEYLEWQIVLASELKIVQKRFDGLAIYCTVQ